MKLDRITSSCSDKNCASGPCPSFYKSDDGRLFIQGYVVASDVKTAAGEFLPDGEDMVEIDAKFLENLKAHI